MKPLEIYISHPKPDSAMGNTGISVKTSTFLMIALGCLVLVDVLIQTAAASEPEQIQTETNYTSVFDIYINWEWEDLEDWVGANQNVAEIGGWQVYSRESEDRSTEGQDGQ